MPDITNMTEIMKYTRRYKPEVGDIVIGRVVEVHL